MTPNHQAALTPCGYTIQFPTLGLPDLDPASPWAPVRFGYGKKSVCQALLLDPTTEAPLRSGDGGDYAIQEIEYEGFVWFLPLLEPLNPDSLEPEIFTVSVRRVPLSDMPSSASSSSSKRMRIPEPVQLIYLGPPEDPNSSPPTPVWPPLPSVKIAFQPGEDSHSDVFDMCLNPISSYCMSATPEDIESLSDEADDSEWKKEYMKAWRKWATFCVDEVNLNWLKTVHREAVRAGLRRKPAEFDRKRNIVRLRAQAAPQGKITALEYALCREEDGEVPLRGEWKALPDGAYSEDFVRCTINMLRKDTGKRLLRREEWPIGGEGAEEGGEGEGKGKEEQRE